MGKITMSVKELAVALGIGDSAAYQLSKSADFPSVRVGRRIVIPKVAFEQWLINQTKEKYWEGKS